MLRKMSTKLSTKFNKNVYVGPRTDEGEQPER